MLLPGATIGVIGGGQLGRMLALVARQMGYRIVVLDPNPRCPTAQVSDGVVVGSLDDLEAAQQLAAQVDVITLDTEHVPSELLAKLEELRPVRPSSSVLAIIQDRLAQKQFLDRLGLPQARWAAASSPHELESAVATVGLPSILKIRRAGYDGKGQVRINLNDSLADAWARLRDEPAVLETLVPFVREISVVMARGLSGEVAVFPIAENLHVRHVLHTTRAPAVMPEERRAHAIEIATRIAVELDHVGVLAVEMFELSDGTLLVNEIAPRTHNSGHYTFGACATSQFEQQVRAICGLPLGDPSALIGAVMLNLFGELWANGAPPWEAVLADPKARLHLYGKAAPAPGRKMGHVLVLDDNTDESLVVVEAMLAKLRAR